MKVAWRAFLPVLALLAFSGCRPSVQGEKTVDFVTLMSHPALDELARAAKEQISADAQAGHYSVRFIDQNANQQINLVPMLVAETLQHQPDVVVAITTPVAQAFRAKMPSRLVFAAVTDPVSAGVVADMQSPGPNITGTSDAWPYRDQLLLIKEILPSVRTIAVLYNPGEAASQFGIREIRRYAAELGLKIDEVAVNTVAEVGTAARIAAPRADALFLSSDNTVIGGAAAAVSAAIAAKKPLFVGDSGTVRKGGLAAVSVGYAQLGKATGRLVTEFLGGKNNLPVVVGHGDAVYVNQRAAELIGLKIPESVRARATVYTSIEN
jgi:putative tryptophan/tyrosine transport system substrate-binding protein